MNKKMSNYMIVSIVNILDKFANKKLPQKISYAITRNIITLTKEYEIYSKSLNNLYEAYNNYFVRDENNNVMKSDNDIPIVIGDKQKEFNEELTNFLNIEIEVDIYTISEDVFNYDDNNGRYDSLSAIEIINLQNILCENSDDETHRKE